VKLAERERASGGHPTTAYRWWREGILPAPARKAGPRTILVGTAAGDSAGGAGLYARVSCRDQREDLGRQVARISDWAAQAGTRVVRVESEVGSGMDGARPTVRRLLADPRVCVVVAGHRDRLGRMNTELVEAALVAAGRLLVVLDEGEVTGDLVRDMAEVLTWFCARLYGRRPARNRAGKALRCTERHVGPMALSHPDATVSG
jgi:putative resolvase